MNHYHNRAPRPLLAHAAMTSHSNPNEWEQHYGAARRAHDCALLQEAERQQYSLEDDIREIVAREFALKLATMATNGG